MTTIQSTLDRALALWAQALDIWKSGGWCMPPIAVTAMLMFALGIHVRLKIFDKGFRTVPERTWRKWIDDPDRRKGKIGDLLDFVTGGRTLGDMSTAFREVRHAETAAIARDLRVMKVCVGAAPLLGLLGTVTGMLATFEALAGGSGAEQTMGKIAKGISEALITTEAGLIVALPGVFLQYRLARHFDAYKAFLAHLETVCMQDFYRKAARARAAATTAAAA